MSIDLALGSVTFAMAVMGGIVSAHAPTKDWQKWTYGLIFLALGAVGMYFIVKQSNEAAAATKAAAETTAKLDADIAGLKAKLDAFRTDMDGVLATLGPKHYTASATEHLGLSEGAKTTAVPTGPEPQRRQAILRLLRAEYILSHDSLSPGLLAGREWPPLDWLNQRLKELKENWTVVVGPTQGELQTKDTP